MCHKRHLEPLHRATTCITVQAPQGLYFVTAKSRKKYLNYVSALSVNTFGEV
ncbi:hypothetical protein J805_1168 [Acinetobacter sp. 25977_2]|nr:hypothetical protein J805_1168 [Acinetobacter sp. 25977_2]